MPQLISTHKENISWRQIYPNDLKKKKLSVLFTYPNSLDIAGSAAAVWCLCAGRCV